MEDQLRLSLPQLQGTLLFCEGLDKVPQRSRAWHALRSFRLTASDAPLACGLLGSLSVQQQHQQVIDRKVAIVEALNRGQPIPQLGSDTQKQAMAWGVQHEDDGVAHYAWGFRKCMFNHGLMSRTEGLELPARPSATEERLLEVAGLNTLELKTCGLQVGSASPMLSVVDCLPRNAEVYLPCARPSSSGWQQHCRVCSRASCPLTSGCQLSQPLIVQVHPQSAHFAASSDRLICNQQGVPVGQLEVKCPYSKKLPATLPESTRTQVLMQLACQPALQQLAFSDVIYWIPKGSKLFRVCWDTAAQAQWQWRILPKLEAFYAR